MKGAEGYPNPEIRDVYHNTKVVRKPITGIVSGYHELPYVLVAPDEDSGERSMEVTGRINVSPRFIISPGALGESFGEVFDAETFDKQIQGRLFSFAHGQKGNFKVESKNFQVQMISVSPGEHLQKVEDTMMMKEDISSALIYGPAFRYYPVSIDRFINEILDREFRF